MKHHWRLEDLGQCPNCDGYGPLGMFCGLCEDSGVIYDTLAYPDEIPSKNNPSSRVPKTASSAKSSTRRGFIRGDDVRITGGTYKGNFGVVLGTTAMCVSLRLILNGGGFAKIWKCNARVLSSAATRPRVDQKTPPKVKDNVYIHKGTYATKQGSVVGVTSKKYKIMVEGEIRALNKASVLLIIPEKD